MNQAAAFNAVCAASYLEDYLDAVETMPQEVQYHVSAIRYLDVDYYQCLRRVKDLRERLVNSFDISSISNGICANEENVLTKQDANSTKAIILKNIRSILLRTQSISDQQLKHLDQINELLEVKVRKLDQEYSNLESGVSQNLFRASTNGVSHNSMPTQNSPVPLNKLTNFAHLTNTNNPPRNDMVLVSPTRGSGNLTSSTARSCRRVTSYASMAKRDDSDDEGSEGLIMATVASSKSHLSSASNSLQSSQQKASTGRNAGGTKLLQKHKRPRRQKALNFDKKRPMAMSRSPAYRSISPAVSTTPTKNVQSTSSSSKDHPLKINQNLSSVKNPSLNIGSDKNVISGPNSKRRRRLNNGTPGASINVSGSSRSHHRNLHQQHDKDEDSRDAESNNGSNTVTTYKSRAKSANNNNSNNNLEDERDEPTYCLCKQISYGEMIGCDNADCEIEWFHFNCVNLVIKPKGKWYCPNCRGDRAGVMKD